MTPGADGLSNLLSFSLRYSGFIALSFLSATRPRLVSILKGLRYSTWRWW